MMKFRQLLFLVTILIFAVGKHDSNGQSLVSKNIVSINLTQIAVLEARIGYDRFVSKKTSLGLEFAYKPDIGEKNNHLGGSLDFGRFNYLVGNSYTIFANCKFYTDSDSTDKKLSFLEIKTFGRYTSFENKYFNNASIKESSIRADISSGKILLYGFIITYNHRFFLNQRKSLFIDIYGGGGVRAKFLTTQFKTTCYNHRCIYDEMKPNINENAPFEEENKATISLHLGVKTGFSF